MSTQAACPKCGRIVKSQPEYDDFDIKPPTHDVFHCRECNDNFVMLKGPTTPKGSAKGNAENRCR
jgi:hypothetical protein